MEDAILVRYKTSLREMLDFFALYASRDPAFEAFKRDDVELLGCEKIRPLTALIRVEVTIEPLNPDDVGPSDEAVRFRTTTSPSLNESASELL